MRKIYFLFMLFLFSASVLQAQIKITGQVKDADTGEPLPGATIVVKGSTIGTTTNIDGNYSIFATSQEDVLEFSYIGYLKQSITVGTQTIINIDLRTDSKSLDEVIVTAIGIKAEKKSLGYAAQEVKGDDVTAVSEANLINALSSKVAGVDVVSSSGTPGASSNIVIRGRVSLTGNNSPIFVVDGVPISNDYSGSYYVDHSNRAIDINPNDIESITVLKGGAATALYGIRAATGAIIITTKSGKGMGDKRQKITFQTSIGFDQVNKLPEKQYKYAQGYKDASGNLVYSSSSNTSWGPLIDTLRYNGVPNDYYQYGNIVGMSDPTATNQKVIGYDNINDFFETAIKSDTYLSIGGGNKDGNYHVSLGHLDQSGIVPNSEFKRTNVKLAGDMQLSEKLKLSGNAMYSNSNGTFLQKGSNLSAVMVGLMRVTPTFDITNGSSDPVNDQTAWMLPDGTQRNYYPNYDNPYWSINKNKATSDVNRLIGNAQFDYKLLPWLNVMYRAGLDYYNEKRHTHLDNNSSDTPDGYVSINTYEFKSINSDLILTAEKNLSDDIKISGLFGHNYYTRESYSLSSNGDLFVLPDFYDLSNTSAITSDDAMFRKKMVGLYYDIKLAYKNYLYLNTTGRNDWSSTLPTSKNHFFYPSVSVGFIFSDAFKLKDKLSFFDYGKLRVSWAKGGNDAPLYALEDYYGGLTAIQGQVVFATQRGMGNGGITPEETYATEVGLDLRFFGNRVGIDFAYYYRYSDGQIIAIPVTYSTGYNSLVDNAGVITNEGIELQLYLTPIQKEHFIWDITANFSKNKNIVEDLPDGVPFIEFATTGLSSTRSLGIEGQPFGVLYGGRYLRNENGDVIVDNEGYPQVDPEAGVVGDPNPDFILGLRNSFTYKGLTLSALIDVKYGGDIYNGTRAVMTSLGTHKDTENREEDYIFPGVRNDGTEENPVWVENDVAVIRDRDYYSKQGGLAGLSEAYIEDGSYVRLREVSLMYNLPSKWLGRLPISSLSIGLSGKNLLLFTDYSGIDPETNLSGASNSMGRDYFNMPNTRSFELSLRMNL